MQERDKQPNKDILKTIPKLTARWSGLTGAWLSESLSMSVPDVSINWNRDTVPLLFILEIGLHALQLTAVWQLHRTKAMVTLLHELSLLKERIVVFDKVCAKSFK